jgi:hypothetical protein
VIILGVRTVDQLRLIAAVLDQDFFPTFGIAVYLLVVGESESDGQLAGCRLC